MDNLKSTLVILGALASDMSKTHTKLLVLFLKVNKLNEILHFGASELTIFTFKTTIRHRIAVRFS